MTTWTQYSEVVTDYLQRSKAIAWDGCHKIYILMDDEQVEQMKGYGYEGDYLISTHGKFVIDVLAIVESWWEDSCGLRFINAVATHPTTPDEVFTDLIPQGADWEQED